MRFNLISLLAKFLDSISQRITGKSDTNSNTINTTIYLAISEIKNIRNVTKEIITKKKDPNKSNPNLILVKEII